MKDIPGYEGIYAACENGEIWSFPKDCSEKGSRWKDGRFLKSWLIGNGYKTVSLYKDGSSKKFLIHRLIATTFIENPFNFSEVNHKDGNRLNNSVSNLEWVNSSQNKKHAWERGLYKHRGTGHYLTKFTDKDIIDIRNLYKEKTFSIRKISSMYNVTPMTINGIVKGKTWKHIP